ncbi:DUF1835 domain-containing protein [Paenibacillus pasadenensis]|uniref:DUF1835 domain-containing protein n=1 Tax=Paenibacillus pasadenensis TaxID=217090 RepID=UPI00203EDB03|nr:DUF1835 domain-containing protein [Paenibacillus pasadenensis]MCM3749659.1 DUF1835 domain-containing protein [Paenibacillus pasadenensis]
MQKILQAAGLLEDGEARALLRLALLNIRELKATDKPVEEAVDKLILLYDSFLEAEERTALPLPGPDSELVHIVCGESFGGSLRHALRQLNLLGPHVVVTLPEHYAIGPLEGWDTPEGIELRTTWFRDHICYEMHNDCDFEAGYAELLDTLDRIPAQAGIIVWTSRSVVEQIGMRHVLHLLQDKLNPIAVYDACDYCEGKYNRTETYINYKRSGEIPTDKLREALLGLLAAVERKGADSEGPWLDSPIREKLRTDWQDISKHSKELRIWQNGAVVEVSPDYFDSYLLERLDEIRPPHGNGEFVKSARLIGGALGYCDQDISEYFFVDRLRQLAYCGALEIKGIPAAMRFFSVRRKKQNAGSSV